MIMEDDKLCRNNFEKQITNFQQNFSKSLISKSKSMKNMPNQNTPSRYRLKPPPVIIYPKYFYNSRGSFKNKKTLSITSYNKSPENPNSNRGIIITDQSAEKKVNSMYKKDEYDIINKIYGNMMTNSQKRKKFIVQSTRNSTKTNLSEKVKNGNSLSYFNQNKNIRENHEIFNQSKTSISEQSDSVDQVTFGAEPKMNNLINLNINQEKQPKKHIQINLNDLT